MTLRRIRRLPALLFVAPAAEPVLWSDWEWEA